MTKNAATITATIGNKFGIVAASKTHGIVLSATGRAGCTRRERLAPLLRALRARLVHHIPVSRKATLMQHTYLAAFAIATIAAPLAANAGTARCLLEIDGKTYIDGPCSFTPAAGGSFGIGSTRTAEGRWGPIPEYYASVMLERPGVATAAWNEERFAEHAHSNLGTLRRSETDKACWENERARICAW